LHFIFLPFDELFSILFNFSPTRKSYEIIYAFMRRWWEGEECEGDNLWSENKTKKTFSSSSFAPSSSSSLKFFYLSLSFLCSLAPFRGLKQFPSQRAIIGKGDKIFVVVAYLFILAFVFGRQFDESESSPLYCLELACALRFEINLFFLFFFRIQSTSWAVASESKEWI
jgi:hypothetical protein